MVLNFITKESTTAGLYGLFLSISSLTAFYLNERELYTSRVRIFSFFVISSCLHWLVILKWVLHISKGSRGETKGQVYVYCPALNVTSHTERESCNCGHPVASDTEASMPPVSLTQLSSIVGWIITSLILSLYSVRYHINSHCVEEPVQVQGGTDKLLDALTAHLTHRRHLSQYTQLAFVQDCEFILFGSWEWFVEVLFAPFKAARLRRSYHVLLVMYWWSELIWNDSWSYRSFADMD